MKLRYLKPSALCRRQSGLSLIEVTLALSLIGFAIIPLIGLLAVGFSSYRSAQEISVEAAINQYIRAQCANLTAIGQTLPPYYFEMDGTETSATSDSAAYKVVSAPVTVVEVAGSNSVTLGNHFSIIRLASAQIMAEAVIHITPR